MVTVPEGWVLEGPAEPQAQGGGATQSIPEGWERYQPTWGETAVDAARAIPAGITRGIVALPGLPVDLAHLIEYGTDWLDKKFNLRTEEERARIAQNRADAEASRVLPTGQEVVGAFERYISGPLYQPQTRTGRLAGGASEFVGGAIAGPVAGGARALTTGARTLPQVARTVGVDAARYGVVPGATSEAAGQAAEGTGYETAARIAGAFAGPAVASAARSQITRHPTSQFHLDDVRVVEDALGTPVMAGQRTGERNVRYLEAESGTRGQLAAERIGESFTEWVYRQFGQQGVRRSSQETVDRAFRTLGAEYDDLARRNPLVVDRQMLGDAARVQQNYVSMTGHGVRAPVIDTINNAIQNMRGAMTGQQYQAMTSFIEARARAAGNSGNWVLADALRGMRGAIDNAMERTIAVVNPGDLGRYRAVDRAYRNLVTAEPALATAADGLVSPLALRTQLKSGRENLRDYSRGRGDFDRVVNAAANILKPLPDSGTGSRVGAKAMFTSPGAMIGAGLGGGGGFLAGGGMGTGVGAGIGAAVGGAISRGVGNAAVMSPLGQRYLGNQLMSRPAEPLSRRMVRGGTVGGAETLAEEGAPESPLRLTVTPGQRQAAPPAAQRRSFLDAINPVSTAQAEPQQAATQEERDYLADQERHRERQIGHALLRDLNKIPGLAQTHTGMADQISAEMRPQFGVGRSNMLPQDWPRPATVFETLKHAEREMQERGDQYAEPPTTNFRRQYRRPPPDVEASLTDRLLSAINPVSSAQAADQPPPPESTELVEGQPLRVTVRPPAPPLSAQVGQTMTLPPEPAQAGPAGYTPPGEPAPEGALPPPPTAADLDGPGQPHNWGTAVQRSNLTPARTASLGTILGSPGAPAEHLYWRLAQPDTDPGTIQRAKSVMGPQAWQEFSSAKIRSLGRQFPESPFNPETFAASWEQLPPGFKNQLDRDYHKAVAQAVDSGTLAGLQEMVGGNDVARWLGNPQQATAVANWARDALRAKSAGSVPLLQAANKRLAAAVDERPLNQRVYEAVTGPLQAGIDTAWEKARPFIPPELRPKVEALPHLVNAVNPVLAGNRFRMAAEQGDIPGAALEVLGIIPGEAIAAGVGKAIAAGKAVGAGATGFGAMAMGVGAGGKGGKGGRPPTLDETIPPPAMGHNQPPPEMRLGKLSPYKNMTEVPSIRGMPVEDAVKIARREPHLIASGASGEGAYVGGPRNIKSRADLIKMRRDFDKFVAQNIEGADWYDRYRASVGRVTGEDPAAMKMMAHQHGQFSAGVAPEHELGLVLRENEGIIAGQPVKAGRIASHEAVLRAEAMNDPTQMARGKKTGEYAWRINPSNLAQVRTATGVNDFRHQGNLGYTNPDGSKPASGKHMVGNTYHTFMDYETALAVDRANRKRLGGRSDWTGEQLQAAPWVLQKAYAIKSRNPRLSFDDAFARANTEIGDFFDKHTLEVVHERIPGDVTGHRPGLQKAPDEVKDEYSRAATWATAPGGRDAIVAAMRSPTAPGIATRVQPTTQAQGLWVNSQGELERNLAEVARPLVGIQTGPGGTRTISPEAAQIQELAAYLRAMVDAQAGQGGTLALQSKAGLMGSVAFPTTGPLSREQAGALREVGQRYGFPDLTDRGTGFVMTNFPPGAPPSGVSAGKVLRKGLLEEEVRGIAPDVGKPKRVFLDTTVYADLSDLWTKGHGSGQVVSGFFEKLDRMPGLKRALDEDALIPQGAMERYLLDEKARGSDTLREDLQNMRKVIGEGGPGWVSRLENAWKAGVIPLPALALFLQASTDEARERRI